MATLRELKTRIGSVASSEKITGAMKMISSAKVHKNEQALRQLLPFKNQIRSIMGHILQAGCTFTSPLIEEREHISSIALVVFGSDDGLCGAYNMNIFKSLLARINALRDEYGKDLKIEIFPVGKKIFKAVSKIAGPAIRVTVVPGVDSKMEGQTVNDFTLSLQKGFIDKEYDRVEVVYMQFHSISRQKLTDDVLFPVSEKNLVDEADNSESNKLYIFEPNANRIFNEVLPMFVLSTMQEITIENRASEQAARVMAMQSANDNAKKLQESLNLEYNKLRQENITTELLDILGGQVER